MIYHEQFNLIIEITRLLKEANHPNPDKWLDGLNAYLNKDEVCINKIQRVLINQYWAKQLSTIESSTLYERLVLRMKVKDTEFLNAFKISVLPTIIKYNLGI